MADPATGREIRAQIPPHRFDHQHVRIELEILEWPPTTIPALTTLTLDAIGTPRRLIELDAKGLDIHTVRLGQQEVPFVYQDELLSIWSEEPFHPGNPFQVTISYTISNLEADGIGLSLFPSDLGGNRFVLSSQGQTDHNSRWFPHRDAPDDPATTEIIVRTASPDLHVLATGANQPVRTGRDGTSTHTVTLAPEHPLYLTALTVGHWELATLPDPAGTLPMRVYTETSLTDGDRQILEQTGPMLRYFELIFDEPYPWHAYDHVFLPGVTWSMEHTSISFMDADLLGTGTRLQDVVAHELAHHWFGNLVTCRDWSELWLNEGLATYCELLWAEQQARRQRQPTDVPRSRLLTEWRDDVFGEGHLGFPRRMAIANHRYLESDDQFGQADSPYSKGAYIIHMLRQHLGDPVFFQALAAYLDEHKHSSVTTKDLRRAFEQASGLSLERFFDQWTRRAGFPVVSATTFVEGDAVNVRLEQTQTIDADNPAYELRVPVVFRSTDGVETTKFVQFAARTAEQTLMLPFSGDDLASVAIDPDRSLLMDLTVVHSPVPTGATHGTTHSASHSASHATSNMDSETH